MASARYVSDMEDDESDQGAVQSAINKAMQAWLKENPESDDDERGPSKPSKQRKVSYRSGSTISQNFYADDGSMKCTLCSSSGFLNKDQLRQHINTHHTGGYQYYCKLCTKRFRFKTTYTQHLQMDHKDDTTFDRSYARQNYELQEQIEPNIVQDHQQPSMEVVLEEEVVTEPTVEITYVQPQVNHDVQPVELAVNGDIRLESEPVPVPVVVATPEPIPVPKPRPQIDPTEQSVLISPTLEAPKRRINYTGMRSPAKQVRQEVVEDGIFKFRCNLCKAEFPDKNGLTHHLNSFHTGENRYYCKFCTRRFQIKANFEHHLELDHGRDKFGRELPKKQVQRPVQKFSQKQPTIRVGTTRQVILTDSLHDPNVDVLIDTETAEDRKTAQEKIQKAYQDWLHKRGDDAPEQSDKKCVCPICNVTMANKYKLEKHIQGHENPKKIMPKVRKCYHCDRVFQEGWQLDRHLEAYHTHRCSKCDRVFNNLGDLDIHFVMAHAKKKPGRKSEVKEETPPPPELHPEVPFEEANKKGKIVKKTTKQTVKQVLKGSSNRKRPAPEIKTSVLPKKIKVQLKKKKPGRPKKKQTKSGTVAKKPQPTKETPKKGRGRPPKNTPKTTPAKKSPTPKEVPKKTPLKKSPTPKKTPLKKSPEPKKTPSKKSPTPKKTPSKKSSTAKKTPSKKTPVPKKSPPAKKTTAKESARKSAQKDKTSKKNVVKTAKQRRKGSESLERKSPRKPHPKRLPDGFLMTGSEWKVGLKVRETKTITKSKSAQRKSPTVQKRTRSKYAAKKTAGKKVVSKKVKAKPTKVKKVQPKKAQTVNRKKTTKVVRATATPAKGKATPTKRNVKSAKSKVTPVKKTPKSSSATLAVSKSKTGRQVFKYEARSSVWECFGFYMSGSQYEKVVAICLLCGEEKKYSADGSTANLRGHVQHQHKDVWSKKFTPKKSGKKK